MEKRSPRRAIIVAVIVAVFGFRYVTQAGAPVPVMQNDGKAVVGGIMILLAGIIFGLVLATRVAEQKGKNSGKV